MSETNEKTKFDTTQPFLTIVPDEIAGGYFERTDAVYLVNPLDKPLVNVYERVGRFFSADDAVFEAKPNTKGPFEVEPHSALTMRRFAGWLAS